MCAILKREPKRPLERAAPIFSPLSENKRAPAVTRRRFSRGTEKSARPRPLPTSNNAGKWVALITIPLPESVGALMIFPRGNRRPMPPLVQQGFPLRRKNFASESAGQTANYSFDRGRIIRRQFSLQADRSLSACYGAVVRERVRLDGGKKGTGN